MRAELTQIDLSPIDELVRIRKEEMVLEERLAKMEAKNTKVSPVVYARVKSDYEARRGELARESQPLKEKAHREYQRLKALRAAVERAVEQLSLEKEELEFREELGEFPEDAFAKQVADCEKRLADERRDLEDVLRVRDTFVAAFRSEDELESGAPSPGPAPSPSTQPPPPPPLPPPPSAPPVPGAARLAADSLTPDGTVITVVRVPSPGAPAPSASEMPPPSHSATVVLPRARLSLLAGDEPVKEFALKPGVSVIGRLPQSDIQLPSPDVSRRHAQVTLTPDGCFVSDLGSENGVAVNGALVENHRLEDGDVVVLGKQRLIFHV
jgi:hypothetical protein